MLLQHKDLLPLPSQRVAAIFILHELYRSELQQNGHPFTQFFIELLQPHIIDDRTVAGMTCGHTLSHIERWFLAHLLTTTPPKDVRSLHHHYIIIIPLFFSFSRRQQLL